MQLILASASPRRRQMFSDLGLSFRVEAPQIDETRLRGEPAHLFVQRISQEKAEAARHRLSDNLSADWAILAADTVVVHGQQVLGKPRNKEEAVKMLRKLSGRTHEVITGYCWLGSRNGKSLSSVGRVRTKVTFSDMCDDFWRWYVSTGEPMDKAGAYAAQGIGMSFIEKVSGSYSNVVGLPLSEALESFSKLFKGDLREFCGSSR